MMYAEKNFHRFLSPFITSKDLKTFSFSSYAPAEGGVGGYFFMKIITISQQTNPINAYLLYKCYISYFASLPALSSEMNKVGATKPIPVAMMLDPVISAVAKGL